MQRYLLVLNMDLLAVDEQLALRPINHLVERHEREPCDVVVLSLVDTSQARLPAAELLLGAQVGKMPVAPRPDHDIDAAAEHRMTLAIRALKMIGCQATGLVSDEPLVKAVRAESRSRDFDEVILATSPPAGRLLARAVRVDPIHRLRRRFGQRLIVFPPSGAMPPRPGGSSRRHGAG
jgi:hypothetical protein